ncbi:polycomb group RING finger protein 3 isoform X1 [Calonectris borealis]|uniref:polycomb group RING finger protein 3 isoform X1 n=1 Tax=Calonectris borealis TaxID=1323832 RepID=UPI003F4C4B22
MRPERGAPARLRSGRARLFPPLCFKLRAEPFNFTPPPPPFFFFNFLAGEGKRGWCLPLSRVTSLASSAFSLWWRPEKDGPGNGGSGKPPASPERRPRPSPANGHGAAPPPSVCRSCLVKYLEENNTCPTCRIVIHQSHPLQYIGHDRTMQDIVYKLVPGLQEAEMKKQREFYHKLGMEVPGDIKGETCSTKQHLDSHRNGETKTDENSNKETSEEKQEEDNDYHRSDEQVSICLECNSSKLRGLKRKWIRCSAQATVLHLKKFIAKKLNLSSFNELDILCNEEILGKDHTLKFVVVTRWRFKKAPLLLHYRPKMDLL